MFNINNINNELIKNYSAAKSHLIICCTNNDSDFLWNIPHIKLNDYLSIYFKLVIDSNDDNFTCTTVNSQLISVWNNNLDSGCKKLTVKDLYIDANIYSPDFDFLTISEFLGFPDICDGPELYFGKYSNHCCYGAGCIAYKKFHDLLDAKFPNGYYALPSSIHELIFIERTDNEDINALRAMVHAVNNSELDAADILSYEVFTDADFNIDSLF